MRLDLVLGVLCLVQGPAVPTAADERAGHTDRKSDFAQGLGRHATSTHRPWDQ